VIHGQSWEIRQDKSFGASLRVVTAATEYLGRTPGTRASCRSKREQKRSKHCPPGTRCLLRETDGDV